MLAPRAGGVILWTLRFGDEVREAGGYFADIAGAESDAKALRRFASLVGERRIDWSADLRRIWSGTRCSSAGGRATTRNDTERHGAP